MVRRSSWLRRITVTGCLLLLGGAGCFPDFDRLTSREGGGAPNASSGKTGAGSSGGPSQGGSTSGGAEGGAGDVPGLAGVDGGGTESEGGRGGGTSGSAGTVGNAGTAGRGGSSSTCEDGAMKCSGTPGCTDLAIGNADGDTVTDCGVCGTTCSLDNASSAECAQGSCKPSCDDGFADCNAASGNDGCEVDLSTTAHCGSCTNVCSLSGVTGTECVSGHCTPACAPKYLDCNADDAPDKDDGCEVYLDSLGACTPSDGDCDTPRVACDATQVCTDGTCVAPVGVAVLSTPAPTTTGGGQRFADLFPPSADLDGGIVTARVYAPEATAGTLVMFVSDLMSNFSPNRITVTFNSLRQGWTDISLPIASGGAFNAKIVKQVNLEVYPETTASIPTVIYVDGVRASNQAVNDTFDASFGNFVKSTLVQVEGSTIGWAAALP